MDNYVCATSANVDVLIPKLKCQDGRESHLPKLWAQSALNSEKSLENPAQGLLWAWRKLPPPSLQSIAGGSVSLTFGGGTMKFSEILGQAIKCLRFWERLAVKEESKIRHYFISYGKYWKQGVKSQFEKASLDFQWLRMTKQYLSLRERESECDKESCWIVIFPPQWL